MNKPRLIDANELVIESKKCLGILQTFKGYTAEDAMRHFLLLIDEQPTAYDIDNVVRQLEERKAKHEELCPYGDSHYLAVDVLVRAIEIVKDQFTDADKMEGGAE